LARVTPVHYTGTVWCVKVPTGAFVARRNGRVFVTGNSGFPKSANVSKMIDKAAGVVPATAAAHQWDGWGTALKPASEHWWLCRKPLIGTVAANVLAHGTGAINIDGCRVVAVGRPLIESRADDSVGVFGNGLNGSRLAGSTDLGRWPPNILFSHLPECRPVGTRKVATGVAVKHNSAGKNIFSRTEKPTSPDQTYADADGMEIVEAWECAEGCAVAELDRQSGALTSGVPGVRRKPHETASMSGRLGQTGNQETGYADSGGASRFFPTFRYQAKPSKREKETGVKEAGLAAHRMMILREDITAEQREFVLKRLHELGLGPESKQGFDTHPIPRTAKP